MRVEVLYLGGGAGAPRGDTRIETNWPGHPGPLEQGELMPTPNPKKNPDGHLQGGPNCPECSDRDVPGYVPWGDQTSNKGLLVPCPRCHPEEHAESLP